MNGLKFLNIVVLLIGISACMKKDNIEVLPAETQTGRNNFGCYLNGQLWLQTGSLNFGVSGLSVSIENNQFRIFAVRSILKKQIKQVFGFNIKEPLKVGVYNLNSSTRTVIFSDENTVCSYRNDTTEASNGIIEITKYDTSLKIVSGRFNFKASKYINNNYTTFGTCDSTISVTQGRFDIKY